MAKKQVKTQEKKVVRFTWPDFVLYEGREVRCCEKTLLLLDICFRVRI